jgi:DNA-binding response OmpR family regulator
MKQYVLLLEPDTGLSQSIIAHLEQHHLQVIHARTINFALEILDRVVPDILITELKMPGLTNGLLIDRFREVGKSQQQTFVLVSSFERLSDEVCRRYQPDAVVYKPFDVRQLYRRIESLLVKGKSSLDLD